MAGLVNRRASFILGVRTWEREFEHSYPSQRHARLRATVCLHRGVNCQTLPCAGEYVAVTDLARRAKNERHQFCEQRVPGIEAMPLPEVRSLDGCGR